MQATNVFVGEILKEIYAPSYDGNLISVTDIFS